QWRLARKKGLWREQGSINVNAHGVIADDGCAVQIDLRVQRIARIKIKKPGRNFQTTERQRGLDVVKPHPALQNGAKSGAGQMQVAHRAASSEIAANKNRIFCFDCHIKLPITEWPLR